MPQHDQPVRPNHPPTSEPTSGSSRRCTNSSSVIRGASTRAGRPTSRRNGPRRPATARPPRRTAPVPPAPSHSGRRRGRRSRPPEPRRGARRRRPADQRPPAAPGHAAAGEQGRPSRPRAPTGPVPKEKPAPAPADAEDQPTYTVLRGAPARTVANMDDSLTVPTATSVRSVPVKLLWDNRIVINNHLSRARGGKVSFTHLIGYALVKALKAMPEMNVGFDVVDGKPNQITPAHINLGLAIDMQKKDGTRQLLVPNIKGAETMDFAGFWTGYEDIVRKARDGKLTVEDFAGHDDLADQPRHHRHQPLGAAADARPGRDHRRRRHGVPAGVAGRLGGDDRAQRHQQGDDADVDVRPPGHPGRAVRRLPRAHPRAAARRGRLLRRDLPRAADPLRADPLERATSRRRTTTRSASRRASSS